MLETLQQPCSVRSTGRTGQQALATCRPRMAPVCRRPVVCSATQEKSVSQVSTNVCRTCGIELSRAPGGCDQEGRIVGGLGSVPGFGWWPIKAYRPCPGLDQAGVDYVRKGQATNEMLFGGVSLGQSQQQSLKRMTDTAEKGIDVDV